MPYLDLYLMDIKHTNPAKHKEFTGRPNDLMMENARKVALSGKCKLIIRVPVIPTFNDTIEEIQGIARFADTLPGVEQLHLLPYHRLGQDKYIGLGRPYLMEGILPPTKEHMETLKKAAEIRKFFTRSDWWMIEKQQKQHFCHNKNNIETTINS